MKLFTIPNLFTLGNLLCGCFAIVFAFHFNGHLLFFSAYLVGIAAVLDFFDGFVARALKQHSPIGKDLDSLADMVTFGVVPGIVMFHLLRFSLLNYHQVSLQDPDLRLGEAIYMYEYRSQWYSYIPYAAFLLVLFSALRLAKFNNDTRQSDSFIGVPTPANAILICSIPLIYSSFNLVAGNYLPEDRGVPDVENPPAISFFSNFPAEGFGHYVCTLLTNPIFLLSTTVIMCYLLIAEFPLFSLKFKSFGWKGNEIRWTFIGLCLVMFALLHLVAIPLTIVLYILMSVINNAIIKKSVTTENSQ
jgi:CDP-diacylglycerol---serine O-phosphatidyltransferase